MLTRKVIEINLTEGDLLNVESEPVQVRFNYDEAEIVVDLGRGNQVIFCFAEAPTSRAGIYFSKDFSAEVHSENGALLTPEQLQLLRIDGNIYLVVD